MNTLTQGDLIKRDDDRVEYFTAIDSFAATADTIPWASAFSEVMLRRFGCELGGENREFVGIKDMQSYREALFAAFSQGEVVAYWIRDAAHFGKLTLTEDDVRSPGFWGTMKANISRDGKVVFSYSAIPSRYSMTSLDLRQGIMGHRLSKYAGGQRPEISSSSALYIVRSCMEAVLTGDFVPQQFFENGLLDLSHLYPHSLPLEDGDTVTIDDTYPKYRNLRNNIALIVNRSIGIHEGLTIADYVLYHGNVMEAINHARA